MQLASLRSSHNWSGGSLHLSFTSASLRFLDTRTACSDTLLHFSKQGISDPSKLRTTGMSPGAHLQAAYGSNVPAEVFLDDQNSRWVLRHSAQNQLTQYLAAGAFSCVGEPCVLQRLRHADVASGTDEPEVVQRVISCHTRCTVSFA